MDSPHYTLEQRLTALERSHRRLRRITAALLVLLLGVATLGMTTDRIPAETAAAPIPAETLVAKSIQILDDAGRLRVLINARAGVSLLDEEKRPRAVLSVDHSGPGLALYSTSSRSGTLLNVNDDGPALSMRDNAGHTRALLAAIDQGPALILSDEDEHERIALVQRAGVATVGTLDERGAYTWKAP